MKSLEEIRRIKKAVEADLMELPGVIGVGVGYKQVKGKKTNVLAIRVRVKRKQDVPEAEAIPVQIQGVPTDVIEGEFFPMQNEGN